MKNSINSIKSKALKVAIDSCDIFMDVNPIVKIDPAHFKKIISNVCDSNKINFQNDSAKFDFISYVLNIISSDVPSIYSQIFPQVGMNSKGQMVYNSSQWV